MPVTHTIPLANLDSISLENDTPIVNKTYPTFGQFATGIQGKRGQ
jgi:hypothetical protein